MIDLIGHIGYIFIAIGMWQLAHHNQNGWRYRLVGEAIWIGLGLILGLSSIYVWGVVFAVVDCIGYIKWKRMKTSK